jgi:hypothetical protein
VPGRAAELAVGCRLEPGLTLEAHDLADRLVFGRAETRGVEPARRVLRARLEQLGRTEQAADMIGAERRCRSLGHSGEIAGYLILASINARAGPKMRRCQGSTSMPS